MKTAKERAIEIVRHMRMNISIPVHLEEALIGRFTLALKDQDKITRHACAESVLNIQDATFSSWRFTKEDMQSIILNTKAV